MAVAPQESQMNMLDKKLIEELENLNLNKVVEAQNIPTLQPPPASVKLRKNDLSPKNTNLFAATLPKVQKTDFHTLNRNSYETTSDTSQVVNRIWLKQNGSSSTNISTIQTEFGQFKCNQPTLNQPESVYRTSMSNLPQASYSNGENTHLYNNESVLMQNTPVYNNGISNSYNLYAYNPYSLSNNRQYSEVAESVYSEIPEYLYSQVPDETLKPHRPAPPSPLVIVGQPQSMQQIQRKMQVICYFLFLLTCFFIGV